MLDPAGFFAAPAVPGPRAASWLGGSVGVGPPGQAQKKLGRGVLVFLLSQFNFRALFGLLFGSVAFPYKVVLLCHREDATHTHITASIFAGSTIVIIMFLG